MESKSAVRFRHWLKENPMPSSTFEIKDTRGKNCIDFSEIKDVQLDWGLAIKSNNGTLIRVQGMSGEPDYVYFRNAFAWEVIFFPQGFLIIDIETLILEKNRSKRRSLVWSRAKELATIEVLF